MEEKNQLVRFSETRRVFEDVLMEIRDFATIATHKFGSGARSSSNLTILYEKMQALTSSGKDQPAILAALKKSDAFSYLFIPQEARAGKPGARFQRATKSAVFLNDALEKALRCAICGGFMHSKSMTSDHIERRADGGTNSPDNAQITHPFCNSTVKH